VGCLIAGKTCNWRLGGAIKNKAREGGLTFKRLEKSPVKLNFKDRGGSTYEEENKRTKFLKKGRNTTPLKEINDPKKTEKVTIASERVQEARGKKLSKKKKEGGSK